jgi:hypothetical protein
MRNLLRRSSLLVAAFLMAITLLGSDILSATRCRPTSPPAVRAGPVRSGLPVGRPGPHR